MQNQPTPMPMYDEPPLFGVACVLIDQVDEDGSVPAWVADCDSLEAVVDEMAKMFEIHRTVSVMGITSSALRPLHGPEQERLLQLLGEHGYTVENTFQSVNAFMVTVAIAA